MNGTVGQKLGGTGESVSSKFHALGKKTKQHSITASRVVGLSHHSSSVLAREWPCTARNGYIILKRRHKITHSQHRDLTSISSHVCPVAAPAGRQEVNGLFGRVSRPPPETLIDSLMTAQNFWDWRSFFVKFWCLVFFIISIMLKKFSYYIIVINNQYLRVIDFSNKIINIFENNLAPGLTPVLKS